MASRQKIRSEHLAPKIAEGFTDGATAEEAMREFAHLTNKPKCDGIGHLRNPGQAPVLIAEPNEAIIVEPNTGRTFQDVNITRPEEHVDQIKQGYRCLHCGEGPFESAWPKECNVCGFEVSRLQSIRFSAEFEGEKHIGPSKPIGQYLEELEERELKSDFERRISEGKSPMRGLH